MKLYWLLTPLFLLSCAGGGSPSPAPITESFLGIDYKFPTNETMPCTWTKAFDGVDWPVMSFLWRTPGRNYRCLDPFLADGRKKTLVVHLSNGVCRKELNNNCPPNEPNIAEIPSVALEVQQHIKALCPECKVILVPQLEDGLHPDTFCRIVSGIRQKVPEAIIGRNPLYTEYARYGETCFDYLELHNTESSFFRNEDTQCIWSNDGFDLNLTGATWDLPFTWTLSEWEQHHWPGCINLLWFADGNCLNTASYDSPFPADRKCSPSTADISELNRILLENQNESH